MYESPSRHIKAVCAKRSWDSSGWRYGRESEERGTRSKGRYQKQKVRKREVTRDLFYASLVSRIIMTDVAVKRSYVTRFRDFRLSLSLSISLACCRENGRDTHVYIVLDGYMSCLDELEYIRRDGYGTQRACEWLRDDPSPARKSNTTTILLPLYRFSPSGLSEPFDILVVFERVRVR